MTVWMFLGWIALAPHEELNKNAVKYMLQTPRCMRYKKHAFKVHEDTDAEFRDNKKYFIIVSPKLQNHYILKYIPLDPTSYFILKMSLR